MLRMRWATYLAGKRGQQLGCFPHQAFYPRQRLVSILIAKNLLPLSNNLRNRKCSFFSCELVQFALFRRLRQKIGEVEAGEMTMHEIADPWALHEQSVDSTWDVDESPPVEVFDIEVDISSSRNGDFSWLCEVLLCFDSTISMKNGTIL